MAAVHAPQHVNSVRAVADEIKVRHPDDKKTSDDQIAKRALDILKWDSLDPAEAMQVTVCNGLVALSGEVEWQYQRSSAEDDVRKLSGVRDVVNNITIRLKVYVTDVQAKIENALRRNTDVEAKDIHVSVWEGGQVCLDGRVHSLEECNTVI